MAEADSNYLLPLKRVDLSLLVEHRGLHCFRRLDLLQVLLFHPGKLIMIRHFRRCVVRMVWSLRCNERRVANHRAWLAQYKDLNLKLMSVIVDIRPIGYRSIPIYAQYVIWTITFVNTKLSGFRVDA